MFSPLLSFFSLWGFQMCKMIVIFCIYFVDWFYRQLFRQNIKLWTTFGSQVQTLTIQGGTGLVIHINTSPPLSPFHFPNVCISFWMISGEFNEAAHLKWLEEHPTKRPKIKEARKQVETNPINFGVSWFLSCRHLHPLTRSIWTMLRSVMNQSLLRLQNEI